MSDLRIMRLSSMPCAVFGALGDFVTLEPPWRDNHPDVSCIPAGTYTARRYRSPRFGIELFALQDVPGRQAVEIHAGNLPSDTHGCIIVGSRYGCLGGAWAVLDSQAALRQLMGSFKGKDQITVAIEWWRAPT